MQDVDELIKFADEAMYSAKRSGSNTLKFYDTTNQTALTTRSQLRSGLGEALQQEQCLLYFQAQVDSRQRIVGAQALLRWQHPQHGLILPKQFISLAEDNGLIASFSQWVLDEACTQLKRWQDDPLTDSLTLSVNVSTRQFRHTDFVGQVQAALQRTGVDPAKLMLEVTENLMTDNVESVIGTIQVLKNLGVRITIDQFGTGFSSLSHLCRLPLDQVKIDRSFVRDIVSDASNAIAARTIIGLARNLDLGVVAVGVETEAQRDLLLEYDCRVFQGHLFSRPCLLKEFENEVITKHA